ncbi:MAG: cysteine--tRNA ligase [Rhizobiales bacterium]|nr:cysteine--tRNA ligase [Hyphomicrobiales bacterium]MBO6698711.1 cysteine--tRNA ligase [Hyphomicrobiales bacterium]MBO6735036.1 cysteine--tRNA ligase [Hyphomicrobiales bacterium]MBO6911158.1 cysteine--tRNA ligase [Hyphomicrobiales bacterium]MBO6955668.1 cysteine--tRNA ligase [Hyphomicrobiales bacterium]
MTLQFTNTATRTKEPFVPIDETNVRMYVCGPTVYDFAHIGNARPAVVFDVLFRLLRHVYGEDHVTYVRNITDVDDKINARAARDFPDLPLNEAIARVTEKTTAQYHADLEALGCLQPSEEPRATQHIGGMIVMIETLIAKGNAYVADGPEGKEVLFDTASMDGSSGPRYGALSKRNLDEQKAGARVDVEGHKKNPGDFVLWKQSSAEEPGWDSPWGRGRPGWHIECSVMSAHHLGETFDIHGGGLDLIFPHHENEIAQSCCAHGTEKMANTWLHNGFVQVEGRKMSKSEGNFVTIHDVLNTEKVGGRKWPGEVVRLALLMTHYREPLDFSVKRLEEAENLMAKWPEPETSDTPCPPEVFEALLDDLNTPAALQGMQRLCGRDTAAFAAAAAVLGVSKAAVPSVELSPAEAEIIDREVATRLGFIANKDWSNADRIRDALAQKGIQLKDGKDPETGERITTWEVKR